MHEWSVWLLEAAAHIAEEARYEAELAHHTWVGCLLARLGGRPSRNIQPIKFETGITTMFDLNPSAKRCMGHYTFSKYANPAHRLMEDCLTLLTL